MLSLCWGMVVVVVETWSSSVSPPWVLALDVVPAAAFPAVGRVRCHGRSSPHSGRWPASIFPAIPCPAPPRLNPSARLTLPAAVPRRAPRAAVEAALKHCTLQDTTFTRPLELLGCRQGILGVLSAVTDPLDARATRQQSCVDGLVEARTHLYR